MFRSMRKGKKCFCDEPTSVDHKVLHNITSSSSIFDFAWIFSLFSLVFRNNSKFLEFKEFKKQFIIIPFALVRYETGYSQLGATQPWADLAFLKVGPNKNTSQRALARLGSTLGTTF